LGDAQGDLVGLDVGEASSHRGGVILIPRLFFDRISRGVPYLYFFGFQLNERMVCTNRKVQSIKALMKKEVYQIKLSLHVLSKSFLAGLA
jgi:hypothetical protein